MTESTDVPFKPGDVVQIQDRDREPANYPLAIISRATSKGEWAYGVPDDRPGYVVRYLDNGSQVWKPEHEVLAPPAEAIAHIGAALSRASDALKRAFDAAGPPPGWTP